MEVLLSEGYLHGILSLTQEAAKNQFKVHLNTMGNESLITRARNTLVSQFLDLL
jgi:ribosomal protein S8